MKNRRLLQVDRVLPVKGVALSQHVARTPLAKRMLAELGPDDYSLLKTFQERFGARLVHYRDQHGEVGTDTLGDK
jgi:hypothetical protein